jgi:predicted dehydrogenase
VSKYTQSRACWLEAVGQAGQLWDDYQAGEIILRRGGRESRERVDGSAPTLPGVLEGWRDAMLGSKAVPVSALDGLRTLEMADACYRSAAAGAPIGLT